MRAQQRNRYVLINGEELEYSEPDPALAHYLEKVSQAVEDQAVGEEEMIGLIYNPDNPLMDSEMMPGRGMVTRRTLDHPLYRIMTDYLDRKRVQKGTLDLDATESAYNVTVTEAATILDVHPSAVRQAIQSFRLAAWKKGGLHYLRSESLESYDVGRRGPRAAKPSGGPVLRIRCGHAKGIRFAINIREQPENDARGDELRRRLTEPPDPRLQRQLLMAEQHPEPGVVEGLLPTGWLRIGVLTNLKDRGGQRFFVLEPAEQHNKLDFSDFFVRGRFRIAEKENNSRLANKAYKNFNAKWA